jgi:outer membrane autotransporter protein
VGVIGGNELAGLNAANTGIMQVDGNIAATTVTVLAAGTLKTTAARSMEGLFANAGTLDLGGTLTLTAGGGDSDISNATTAIIKLAPADQYTGGEVIVGQSNTDIDAAAVGTITPDASMTSGTLTIIDDNGGGGTAAATNKWNVTTSNLATYALSVDSADLILTATAKSAATIGSELGVSADAGQAIGNAAAMFAAVTTTADQATRTIFNTTMAAGGAGATQLAEQVQGTPAGLSATSGAATAAAGATVTSVGSARMASLRTGNAYASTHGAGFNAGSTSLSSSMWMKPFASFGDQGERKGIAGYDSDTYGIAIGADTRLNAHSILGMSFSYADTDVDGKGASRSRSKIDSYQITAYADYTEKDWYVEGLVGYAYNDLDTTRDITATAAKAKGATESSQFMVNVNAGMPTQVSPGTYFTPSVGLNITHVVNKSYTETGAGALNLAINPEDITIAKASLGGRLHTSVTNSEGTFTPEVRARLLYDMAGDDGSSSNTFTGGGAAFSVKGLDVVEFATSVGAGLAYTPTFDTGMNLSVNYDAEIKENFTGHSANFTLKYAF